LYDEIRQMEDRLRTAMLTSNVAELDELIDERLLFIGPDSGVYRKEDDLELHRSGKEVLTRMDLKDIQVEFHVHTAVVTVLTDMAGVFMGHPFEGRYRYIRTWIHANNVWRVVAGSVCVVVA
jgi:hypothetical protein